MKAERTIGLWPEWFQECADLLRYQHDADITIERLPHRYAFEIRATDRPPLVVTELQLRGDFREVQRRIARWLRDWPPPWLGWE